MKKTSVVNPDLEYEKDFWVVSVIIQNGGRTPIPTVRVPGHVQVAVEGLEPDGREFRGRYELFSATSEEDPHNPKYRISAQDTRISPSEVKIEKFAFRFSYRRPVADVEKMLEDIYKEAKAHQALISAGRWQDLPPYVHSGGYAAERDSHGNIIKHSCASWVNEKMRIISAAMEPKPKEEVNLLSFHQIWRHPRLKIGAAMALTVGLFSYLNRPSSSAGSLLEFKPR